MPTTRRTAVSVFGLLSVAVGAFACVLWFWRPGIPGLSALTVGGVAVLLAILGLARAGTGKLLPALGLLTGLAAVGLWVYSTGWVQSRLSRPDTKQSTAPPVVSGRPGRVDPGPGAKPPPGPSDDDAAAPDNIFNFGRGGVDDSDDGGVAARPPGSTPRVDPVPGVTVPPVAADAGSSVDSAQENLQAARKKLQSAEAAMKRGLAGDAAYRAARRAADEAEAEVKRLRASAGPGSSQLVRASQESMTAKTKLRKVLTDAAAKDPAVSAARREVEQAEAALKAARGR